MNPNALPIALRHRPQWVCWAARDRSGTRTKVPIDPATGGFASTADSETWATFDEAVGHARRPRVSGIGFMFTSDDAYVGVDLDECRVPETGTLTDDAIDIVTRLHSYTEVSPSGTGIHVICRGELPAGQRRHGGVEMYDERRFFTMTGERLVATPDQVCERTAELRAVHQAYVAATTPTRSNGESTSSSSDRRLSFTSTLSDDELVGKAQSAANCEKFTALWEGHTGGYESHSEADMALCCLLAFWTEGDSDRIDRLFRQSGLLRPKWDEVHYADGATYGERTVERACDRVTEYYSTAHAE